MVADQLNSKLTPVEAKKLAAQRQKEFEEGPAKTIVKMANGPTKPWPQNGQKVSRHFAYFADNDRLFVVAREDKEGDADYDKALAYGLSYRGSRELTLLLPESKTLASEVRAPWFQRKPKVMAYSKSKAWTVGLTVDESRDAFEVGEIPEPLDEETFRDKIGLLLDWIEERPDLQRAHRPKYLCWHCRGRAVLKVDVRGSKLSILAGVNSKHKKLKSEPINGSKLAKQQLSELAKKVDEAVEDRLHGTDSKRAREHWFQAFLRARPDLVGLAGEPYREVETKRPTAGSWGKGLIDLLGVDPEGRVRVVETKLGADVMLVLQGLDYWLWSLKNRPSIRAALGVSHHAPHELDYVVDARRGNPLVSDHTVAQANALVDDVPWRFVGVEDWTRFKPQGHHLPVGRAPKAKVAPVEDVPEGLDEELLN